MPKYRYIGPGPIEVISGGEVTRPGDKREFEEEPTWGPWELIDEPEAAPAEPPAPAAAPEPVALPVPSTYENPTIPLNAPKGF